MRTVGIIGGGSWATALAKILTENLDSFHWWMRNEASVEHFNQFHRNPNYLSSVHFVGDKINVTTDLRQVVDACDVLIIATPLCVFE